MSRRVRLCWSGCRAGGELDDLRWCGQVELGQDVALSGGDFGALAEGAGGPGEHSDVQALQLAAQGGPGLIASGLDDADQ